MTEFDWAKFNPRRKTMAAKKKTATKRSTGTKAKRSSSAGKTARQDKAEAPALPRSPRQIAEAFMARMKNNPGLFDEVGRHIDTIRTKVASRPVRAAQVEPAATH